MEELDFSLASTQEIIKELARRAKQKRKQDMKQYGDQKKFADHIGMTHRRYQQFEISGKITLEKFIDVLRGLNALDKIEVLLEPDEEDLFKKRNHKKNINSPHSLSNNNSTKESINNNKNVNIPDVFI